MTFTNTFYAYVATISMDSRYTYLLNYQEKIQDIEKHVHLL